jgi:hypothetical protein
LGSIRAAPAPVLAFGLGGLIPFVGLTALVIFVPAPWYVYWLTTLAQYGAVLLAFVGALQWGYAVNGEARGAQAWMRYGWSVLPALVGWLSLQFPVWTALRMQAPAGRREPPGLERQILRRLPAALAGGSVLPPLAAFAMRWWPAPDPAADVAKPLQLIDALAAGIVIFHGNAVLTVAIACVIVAILKGPARIADSYPLPDRDHPSGD